MYEALARYDDAVIDYKAVLKAAPNDPSGWNNLVSLKPVGMDPHQKLLPGFLGGHWPLGSALEAAMHPYVLEMDAITRCDLTGPQNAYE